MRPSLIQISFAAALLIAAASPASGQTFLIRGAKVFDGERVLPQASVLVRDGRIAAIGDKLQAPAGVSVIDAAGQTLLPGLIDAHVHIADTESLRQALAFGVTTQLDMFAPIDEARDWKLAAARPGSGMAELLTAGTLATAPGGHGTEYGLAIPTLVKPDEALAFVDARLAEGSDYIKIVLDDGRAYGFRIPTLDAATVKALIQAAHARHKLAIVHIGTQADAMTALDAGADGLAHLFADSAPLPAFAASAAAHHAFVVPTLGVLRSVSGSAGGAQLADDAGIASLLPVEAIANLRQSFPKREGATIDYSHAEAAVRALRTAGVPVLAGTDAPNPGTTWGASVQGEFEALVRAGLTPIEALTAATAAPARAFHLADRGRIAKGLRADLLLVQGDPTVDPLALRRVTRVWKAGEEFDLPARRTMIASGKKAADEARAANNAAAGAGAISDFEQATVQAAFGAGWLPSTDAIAGGSSTCELKLVHPGASGSQGALKAAGTISAGLSYAWAGPMFFPAPTPLDPVDLSRFKEILFRARGPARSLRLMFFCQALGRMPATRTFDIGPEWQDYAFPLAEFPGLDLSGTTGMIISAGPAPGAFEFEIDDVKLVP